MKKGLLFLSLFLSLNYVMAQDTAMNAEVNQTEQGIGLEGYDAVSYFIGEPAKGKDDFVTKYEGVTYKFCSNENLNTFLENPKEYLPMYGGWCAYAIGDSGDQISIDPETYKIIGNKLYLFYNAFLNNTLKKWNKDEIRLLREADENWKNM